MEEEAAAPPPKVKSKSTPQVDEITAVNHEVDSQLKPRPSDSRDSNESDSTPPNYSHTPNDYLSAGSHSNAGMDTPTTPSGDLSRSSSADSAFETFNQDSNFPPVDRLTIFDILENFALPQRLERMQSAISDNADKLRRQRAKLTSRALSSKNNLAAEWKKRVPQGSGVGDEQLDKYRRRMRDSVDRLNKRWDAAKTVKLNEKISFVSAVLNIFLSGYLIGQFPEWFHVWYTIQLAYFMPIRWYKYHATGYHYFLADLCYFANFLMILSIWFFPQSKRLFISTYCLAMGNNAVAIAMWRNSLVFHSLDKVTSLFIHIMPCATLHVLVHLISPQLQLERFPAIHTIKFSKPDAPEHYSLTDMLLWVTLPYACWQLAYHFLITVRKRQKIAEGRPTSFTWLRRSYAGNPLGKFVLSFPAAWQEAVFMGIQYSYALLTMLPCPLWFWYRWASAGFLMVVFGWASWNGATFYIDVFGRRMEKELNELRKEVQRMSQDGVATPFGSPPGPQGREGGQASGLDLGAAAQSYGDGEGGVKGRSRSEDARDEGSSTTKGDTGMANGVKNE